MALGTTKPPRRYGPNDVNWDHWLTEGLSLLCFPGDNPINLAGNFNNISGNGGGQIARGTTPAASSGYSAGSGPYGPSATMAQGSSNGIYFGAVNVIGGNTYTIAALCAPPSTTRRTHVFGQFIETDTNNPSIELAMNTDHLGNATAGGFALFDSFSGSLNFASSNTSQIDGGYHLFTGIRNGSSDIEIFMDGLNVTVLNSIGASVPSGTASTMVCGHNSTIDRACDYPVVMVAVWNRVLVGSDQWQLAQDPWQLFIRQRKASAPFFFVLPVGDVLMGQAVL